MKSAHGTIKILLKSDFSSDLTHFLAIIGGGLPKMIKLRTCLFLKKPDFPCSAGKPSVTPTSSVCPIFVNGRDGVDLSSGLKSSLLWRGDPASRGRLGLPPLRVLNVSKGQRVTPADPGYRSLGTQGADTNDRPAPT